MNEIRNGQPWANPHGHEIKTLNYIEDERQDWRCIIDQFNWPYPNWVAFYRYPAHEENRQMEIDAGVDHAGVAIFRVRRRILHGYTVRDCNLASGFKEGLHPVMSAVIIQQNRHNYEKHITNYAYEKHIINYAYPDWYYYAEGPRPDEYTIAIFRVKRREHNGNN